MSTTFLGRQPILNREGQVYAYELLYRQGGMNQAGGVDDATAATSRVIINAISNFGLEKVLGDRKGFINIDVSLLMNPQLQSIPKERFVLEILEDVVVTPEIVERVRDLREEGYVFALDDITDSEEMYQNFKPLFPYVSVIKFEVLGVDRPKFEKMFAKYSRDKFRFLAEKVETEDDFAWCKKLGFHLYQGYFFEKPTVLETEKIEPSKMAIFGLSQKLNSDADIDALEKEFVQNPDLMFNILKYINSSAVGLKRDVQSIRQAITLLGRNALRNWVLLYLYVDSRDNAFAVPLLEASMLRSVLMQYIAEAAFHEREVREKAFFIGTLSNMDALLRMPLGKILEEVALDEDIKEVLLERKHELGLILSAVQKMEQAEFAEGYKLLEPFNIGEEKMNEIVRNAYDWVNQLVPKKS